MDNKDLSELIGILDSINYDEIINSLEIESLKKWIDNHSHVQDDDLNNIIIKLKKILEDNIVTEQEKNNVLVIVSDYSKKQLSEYERISILNGIIKGIVIDGVVNSKEINTLQFWLLNNVDLSKYKSGVRIYHKKFGEGTINKVEPEDDDLKVDINFDKVGHKRLMAKFANLEIIDN